MQLRIESLAFGGEAVAHDGDGRVVFVAGGAPGDLVEVRLVEEKPRFARGELVRVIESGPARVTPPCALADLFRVSRSPQARGSASPRSARLAECCGGCPWMHVDLAAQRAAKQEIVQRALRKLDVEVRQIVAPAPPLGYRVRARWQRQGEKVGYAARRSHEIVDVPACPALDPRLEAAMLAKKSSVTGSLAGLVSPEGEVTLSGEGPIDLGGIEGDAESFTQASWSGNEALRRLVREAVTPAARVLELYAGSGNFTRDLVAISPAGIAVEGEPRAAERLRRLLEAHPGWRALTMPAVRAVEQFAGERFDVVVLDPPRAGAADAIARLGAMTDRVVYVSCDPMTLARDLAQLNFRGWAQPLDLMPHTSHVEVVAVLQSQSTRAK